VPDEQDWRLTARLDSAGDPGTLEQLVARARDPKVVRDVEAAVLEDVVITHDGTLLFAYAATDATLAAARSAIEGVLLQDGVRASISVSRWDDALDTWRQTDPPPSGEAEQAAERDAEAPDSRALVVKVGKEIRAGFEQSMLAWAEQLGLSCTIVEHPHLLTTQVGFTVAGPKRKVDEFADGLRAEERATIRTERTVMASPL
jgi:hypothetical protein